MSDPEKKHWIHYFLQWQPMDCRLVFRFTLSSMLLCGLVGGANHWLMGVIGGGVLSIHYSLFGIFHVNHTQLQGKERKVMMYCIFLVPTIFLIVLVALSMLMKLQAKPAS